jgi:hypothetical protein
MDTFRVVLEGRCIDGFASEAVKASLTRLMRVTEAVAEQLLQGQETTVKQGVDEETGERYLTALRAAGMACRLEPENLPFDVAALAPSHSETTAVDAIARSTPPVVVDEHETTTMPPSVAHPPKRETSASKRVVGTMVAGLATVALVFGGIFLSRFNGQANSDSANNIQQKANVTVSASPGVTAVNPAEQVPPPASAVKEASPRPAANLELPQFLACTGYNNASEQAWIDVYYFDPSGRFAAYNIPTVDGVQLGQPMASFQFGRWSHEGSVLRINTHATQLEGDKAMEHYQLKIKWLRMAKSPERDAVLKRQRAMEDDFWTNPTIVTGKGGYAEYDIAKTSSSPDKFTMRDRSRDSNFKAEQCDIPKGQPVLEKLRSLETSLAKSMYGPSIVEDSQLKQPTLSGAASTTSQSTPVQPIAPSLVPSSERGDTPQFKDYATSEAYRGANHPLVVDSAFATNFRTRLSDTIKNGKPDFAGRYIVARWGCGSGGCNTGAIIDSITGRAVPFPVGLSSVAPLKPQFEKEDGQELLFRLNSRLMIFAGNLDGAAKGDGSDTIEFYEFDDGKFRLLKSMNYGRQAKE